ncbi:hypothetical protein LLE49_27595 [Alicyclobacillus tolerans]|uniref:beta strand repeat-containing protein n=1 Tax=Alicyclobacillus tolerans TaxID=90970 RepID=UPI001F1BAFE6|nr:hypothetical protein [Alicyclobacillus tolerans]MCF8568487.1 hypothetical protein [Alicyclobacillus tolerans]
MKRTLTSIAAATLAIGTLVPVAFASTSSVTWSQKSISAGTSYSANPEGFAAQQSGTMTTFMPVFYVEQALRALGYTANWTGNALIVQTPNGVKPDFSNIQVGTGNAGIYVNGTLVKKVDTMVEGDPASGGKIKTQYMPIYYIDALLQAAGVNATWNGNGWTMQAPSTTSTGAGQISAPAVTGQAVGTGAQASPATSFGKPITVSATLTDPNGNPLVGVNALMDIVNYGGGAPTVTDANGNTLASSNVTTSDGAALQYKVPTNSQGVAAATISVGQNISAGYMIRFETPYNVAGTTSTLKSSKVYVGFVAPNTLGVSPFATSGTPYQATVSNGSNGSAGLVPVSVVIPPNSSTTQAGVPVTFSIVSPGGTNPAFFATSTGSSIGTSSQTVYTDSNGTAVVYVNASSLSPAGTPTAINVSSANYSTVTTYIEWNQTGVVSKLANKSVSGYQTSGTLNSHNEYFVNLGDNATFQATAEDQNGNPVPNAQILIANTQASTTGGVTTDSNSAHGNYVNGSTTTAFPSVAASSLAGSTNPSSLGEVVTTDSAGNFSFSVNDNEQNLDHYYVYSIQGGTVGALLEAPYVQWQASTTLDTIGIAGAGSKISYDSQSITGLVGQAQTSYNPSTLPIVRFDGFAGKDAPITAGLNETYNIATSGEADGSIWGIHVDAKPGTLPSGSEYMVDPNGGYWYVLNPSSSDTATTSYNRGVGSVSLRVSNTATNTYELYVNGTDIGTNTQAGYGVTSSGADGEYAGTVELAAADDDSGNVTVTVSAQGKSATAGITFNGGAAYEGASFTPSQVLLSNGTSQNYTFTLEDSNGNPVANSLATVTFKDAPNLWLTQINGVALTMSELVGTGPASEPTPIPLWDTTGTASGESSYALSPALHYTTGVNVAGVGSWTPSTSGYQTVKAYSNSNGQVTLTFEDGNATYWAGGTSTVSAPAGGNGSTSVTVYSPKNATGTPASSTSQVYVGTNPGNWASQGQINW